jgi:hypothetical protein
MFLLILLNIAFIASFSFVTYILNKSLKLKNRNGLIFTVSKIYKYLGYSVFFIGILFSTVGFLKLGVTRELIKASLIVNCLTITCGYLIIRFYKLHRVLLLNNHIEIIKLNSSVVKFKLCELESLKYISILNMYKLSLTSGINHKFSQHLYGVNQLLELIYKSIEKNKDYPSKAK